ncbi:ArsR/SmtB family transcription factor [Brevibacterium album]|uniref:ArsR/SmtB family transcription factor n=1 Tax=Brevibacterium album TaxID=417948 RepID=UPI000491279E|nr:metalloregulator ArsR/SmtB family transcription factor [Brevibacterium album]
MSALDVLDDPTRRRIVEVLSDGELSAGEVAAEFAMSRPAVSQHLRILLDGDVVTVRTAGRRRLYRLNRAALREAGDWLSAQAGRWERVLDDLEAALDEGRI